MPKKYNFTNEQIEEIKIAIKESKDKNEYRRLECLRLRAECKKELKEIAEITGYNEYHVSKIICKYAKQGIKSIKNAQRKGNHRKLSIEEEKELLAPFLQKAEKGEMLVVSEIHKDYETKTGSKSPKSTIYYMLARHGWRKIMPRSKHPKSKPEEFEAY